MVFHIGEGEGGVSYRGGGGGSFVQGIGLRGSFI